MSDRIRYVIAGSALAVSGWTLNVLHLRKTTYANLKRLDWELSTVQAELDHFDEIGGPEGLLEHQIWFAYLRQKSDTLKSISDFKEWKTKPLWMQLVSIPPDRLLTKY